MDNIEYDCWSNDGETYSEDIGDALEDALQNCDSYEEALEATISAGVSIPPNIKAEYYVENMMERISEELYELCGEYSDHYNPQKDDIAELKEYLQTWLDKQQYNCWGVKNSKYFPITDFLSIAEIKQYYE